MTTSTASVLPFRRRPVEADDWRARFERRYAALEEHGCSRRSLSLAAQDAAHRSPRTKSLIHFKHGGMSWWVRWWQFGFLVYASPCDRHVFLGIYD